MSSGCWLHLLVFGRSSVGRIHVFCDTTNWKVGRLSQMIEFKSFLHVKLLGALSWVSYFGGTSLGYLNEPSNWKTPLVVHIIFEEILNFSQLFEKKTFFLEKKLFLAWRGLKLQKWCYTALYHDLYEIVNVLNISGF